MLLLCETTSTGGCTNVGLAPLVRPVAGIPCAAVLTTVSLLALIGVRYPVQMLPLLLFELTWKAVWVLAIGLPLWRAGRLDPATTGDTWRVCLGSLVFFGLTIPWSYVFRHYLRGRGDRWRDVEEPLGDKAARVVAPASS